MSLEAQNLTISNLTLLPTGCCLSVCVYDRHRRLPALLLDIDAETFTEALYMWRDGACKFWAGLVPFGS